MLHINQKTTSHHKKAIVAEVFISVAMLAVFFSSATQASDITANTVIKLVNVARKAAGVAVLKKNALLEKAAEKKAQDMIDNDYFAHVSPQGKSPWYWVDKVGYDYHYAGENLAINFTNAEEEQQAWMDSPLHKKNILNPDYQEIGVAVKQGVIDGHETTVVVQMFGTPMDVATGVVAESGETETTDPENAVAGTQADKVTNPPAFNAPMLLAPPVKINLSSFFNSGLKTSKIWIGIFAAMAGLVVIEIVASIRRKHEQTIHHIV